MVYVQLPSRSVRSLWFSFNFDSSIICFIISSGFGWPLEAAEEPVEVAGDEAVVCANEGAAINVANRIVASGIDIFMAPILPVPGASDKFENRQVRTVVAGVSLAAPKLNSQLIQLPPQFPDDLSTLIEHTR
jgi:hypothetical protein